MPAGLTSRTRGPQAIELPIWPLWVFFAGFPIAWILGLGGFISQIAAIPMAVCLVTAGRIRVPKTLGVWSLFLLWMLLSIVEVSGSTRLIGFAYRATLYLAATVVFIYVYNSSPQRLPLTRVCAMGTVFLGFVVLGGLVGMADPHGSLATPFQHLLPASIIHNELVGKLVHPPFAQISVDASSRSRPRPAAPFPYTNTWGVNFAFAVPFVVAWLAATPRRRVRYALVAFLVISLIPAAATLNRGMALGLGVGMIYVALRFAVRGHGRALVGVLVVAGIIVAVASALNVGAKLDQRLSTSQSADSRTAEYTATYDEAKQSPLLGYGAPGASTVDTAGPDLGTQGQLWTVLYSSGFPGAAFYLLALFVFAWATRRVRSPAMMWIHAVSIIALAVVIVYGILGTELVLLMTAIAVALRDRPVRLRALPRTPNRAPELATIGA